MKTQVNSRAAKNSSRTKFIRKSPGIILDRGTNVSQKATDKEKRTPTVKAGKRKPPPDGGPKKEKKARGNIQAHKDAGRKSENKNRGCRTEREKRKQILQIRNDASAAAILTSGLRGRPKPAN